MSEVGGMIKNGIERKWSPEEIKSSLISSGYSEQEINYELNLALHGTRPMTNQVTNHQIPTQNPQNPQNLSNYQHQVPQKKASNKTIWAIVILLSICILAGIGLLVFKLFVK